MVSWGMALVVMPWERNCKGLSQALDGHMTQGFMVAVGARMGNFTYVSWGLLRSVTPHLRVDFLRISSGCSYANPLRVIVTKHENGSKDDIDDTIRGW